jgi:hypothetical protein
MFPSSYEKKIMIINCEAKFGIPKIPNQQQKVFDLTSLSSALKTSSSAGTELSSKE